jgi:O-antigen/teichoic acid export membrane protein
MARFVSIILIFLTLCALALPYTHPAFAQESVLTVYYAGPDGSVKTALELAEFNFTEDITQADVIVLNGEVPDVAQVIDQLKSGTGVVLVLGAEITAEQLSALLGTSVRSETANDPITVQENVAASDGIVRDILWNTAPQVVERQKITGAGLNKLVFSYNDTEIIIGSQNVGQGKLYVITASLDGDNQQFREWGYYNYLIYNLVMRAGGQQPLSFGDYPASPVPHPNQRMVLYLFLAGVLMISAIIFYFVRRYSLAHPELLNTLVLNRKKFVAREAGTDWEKIGLHRPLGGFMFALMTGLFLFIPQVVYQEMILPQFILPSAQAMGIYGRVVAFFPIVWSFFDMGTSVAHMKYFSEYRVRNPQRAIQYAQFFVWWQALTGAIQVAMVVAVAGTFMPKSFYALYTWSVITHTLIQIPGFYRLFTDAFSGIQRSDYGTILDMCINMVFPMVAQASVVTLLVWWGKNNPVFGASMAGVLGLGFAAYFTEVMSFILGWFLYKRLGYNSKLLLMAHFNREVMVDSLKYGIFLFLSGLIGGLASSLNVLIVQSRLLNNNEVLGNMGMASGFVFAFTVFQSLTGAMMPSISEAISNGRRILAQYYAANGYKYGGMVSGFVCAILLSVADRFIIGSSGPTFQRAAIYVVPMVLAGTMSFATWNADMVMYGSGKTRLFTVMSIIDLVLGLGLSYLLVERFQVYGLLAVPFITTPIRVLLSYYLNNRYCFPQRFYFWQTVVAPVLAGGVHLLIMRFVTGLIWNQDELTSIIILVIALIPSYPLYAFLYGLMGGWDVNTLAVFDRGTKLSSFMRPFTRLFYHASALGARISPLHNRFPFTNHVQAMEEAQSLTEERVAL